MKKKREEFKRWQEQMRRAEEERRREARLKAAGLAARRLRDMTFRTFQKRPGTEAALDAVRRFLQGFSPHCGRGLLLVGNTGSGKTHLAVAVAHYLLEKGHRVVFANVSHLLASFRWSYRRDDDGTEEEMIRRMIDADLLVLDDLGVDKPSEWVDQVLYTIVDARYQDYRPLIVTTNCSLIPGTAPDEAAAGEGVSEFGYQVGQRVESRVMGMCEPVVLTADDYRLKRG